MLYHQHSGSTQNLTIVLSHCLQVWLKQPLVCLEDIQQRHNIVDALVEDPLLRERLRNLHLRGDPTLVNGILPSCAMLRD